MTFIASVIAKNGVALIADSLVTTSEYMIHSHDFLKYLKEKENKGEDNDFNLSVEELMGLFKAKPSYTKDYEEKLFPCDKHSAISCAGMAIINDKNMHELVEGFVSTLPHGASQLNKKTKTKAKDFAKFLDNEVREHLNKYDSIDSATFLFTNYNHKKKDIGIYRIYVFPSQKSDLQNKDYKFVGFTKSYDFEKVVCIGQNRISERILFGEYFAFPEILPNIIKRMTEDFGIKETEIPKNYVEQIIEDDAVKKSLMKDIKINRLRDLSLQQAVDLAKLLMRIEMDFQSYTENIPTVGGVIKVAVIDKEGFRFIAGNTIS